MKLKRICSNICRLFGMKQTAIKMDISKTLKIGTTLFLGLLLISYYSLKRPESVSEKLYNIRTYANSETKSRLNEYIRLYKETKDLKEMYQENQKPVYDKLPKNGFMKDHANYCWKDEAGEFGCIPKVFLGGFAKCGSTDLYEKLIWHPDMVSPKNGKENHYWTKVQPESSNRELTNYIHRVTPVDFESDKTSLIVDGSPSFFLEPRKWNERFPDSHYVPYMNADMMASVAPDLKSIAIVRNPVEMAWSRWLFWDHTAVGSNPDQFHEAIVNETTRFNDCLEMYDLRHCALSQDFYNNERLRPVVGIYVVYLAEWKEYFSNGLKVITMEQYSNNPLETVLSLYEFIGVTTDVNKEELSKMFTKVRNMRKYNKVEDGEMLPKTREILEDFYRPFNKMLALLFDDPKFLFGEELNQEKKDLIYGESRDPDENEWGRDTELSRLLHGDRIKVVEGGSKVVVNVEG